MNTKKLVLTALSIALLSGGAALAGPNGNGNGNSNGKGKGANDNERNTNGAIASELKWRNAGHASTQAFSNANPESAVGLLATLKSTTDAYNDADIDPEEVLRSAEDINGDLGLLEVPVRSSKDIQDELDLLEDGVVDADLSAELLNAKAYEALVAELAAVELTAAKDDAEAAVGMKSLSEDAIIALWALLDGK